MKEILLCDESRCCTDRFTMKHNRARDVQIADTVVLPDFLDRGILDSGKRLCNLIMIDEDDVPARRIRKQLRFVKRKPLKHIAGFTVNLTRTRWTHRGKTKHILEMGIRNRRQNGICIGMSMPDDIDDVLGHSRSFQVLFGFNCL